MLQVEISKKGRTQLLLLESQVAYLGGNCLREVWRPHCPALTAGFTMVSQLMELNREFNFNWKKSKAFAGQSRSKVKEFLMVGCAYSAICVNSARAGV